MNAPVSIANARSGPSELANIPDQAVDMFTERGFQLAMRVAKAFASSNAVPAQFQSHNLKKVGNEEHWVENTSAVGNCLVAMEVARAVGMSIAAVMQNADMIEGKLRWSGKFVVSAINASGRFTPLRFQMINRGKIVAKYKEKTGWDNAARRPIFTEREVEVDDVECIAWALPKGYPEPRIQPEQMREYKGRMLDLYRDIGMPVIESAPVTMRMAVEEGWYGKSGSKWQTEMRVLMFQYRSGSFFGNIHAPDVVMGMGRTTEEVVDTQVLDLAPDGTYTVTTETLRSGAMSASLDTGEIIGQATTATSATANKQSPSQQAETVTPSQEIRGNQEQQTQKVGKPVFDMDSFSNRLDKCESLDTLDVLADEVSGMERDKLLNEDQAQTLLDVYRRRREELKNASAQAQAQPQATGRRRAAGSAVAPE